MQDVTLAQAESILAAAHELKEQVEAASLVTARGRRRMKIWVATAMAITIPVAAYFAVTFHDEHVEHCLAFGYPTPQDEAMCDLTFPFHTHEPVDAHQKQVIFDLIEEYLTTNG